MSAIILDGQLKSALAAVRSLGRAGISVSVGAVRETGMALHSRHASAWFVYPSPYTDQEGFIREVKKEAKRLGDKPVVYAFSDATYLSLYSHRKDLCEYMTLIFPDEKSVEIAYDKAATYSLARVSGVPTMSTYTPESYEEIVRLSETLTYPAVLKTRRSVTWKDGVGIFGSASFVQDKEDLKNNFQELKEKLGEAPLVQDFLLGEEYGVEMLAQNGEVYARVSHHRMRSLSPTGGASVLKETLRESDLKNTMETYAAKLAKVLAWSGPIMVEFKVDSDTREPRLMEINGRFWGSLPLSVSAGVDMPYLYFIQATKGTVPSSMAVAYEGVITNHFLGDVMHLVRVLVKIDPMRKFLYPTRVHAIRDFCILPVGTKADVFAFQDPKPALFEVIDALKKIWK
ncbi:MAG: ATP-grasp domain-containing protein [Minisyncoccia bacterium]